jgi:hypothetical protein
LRLLLATAVCMLLTSSSYAATNGEPEYIVVRDQITNKCKVFEARPEDASNTRIDTRLSYPTRTDAENGLLMMKACIGTAQGTTSRWQWQ